MSSRYFGVNTLILIRSKFVFVAIQCAEQANLGPIVSSHLEIESFTKQFAEHQLQRTYVFFTIHNSLAPHSAHNFSSFSRITFVTKIRFQPQLFAMSIRRFAAVCHTTKAKRKIFWIDAESFVGTRDVSAIDRFITFIAGKLTQIRLNEMHQIQSLASIQIHANVPFIKCTVRCR